MKLVNQFKAGRSVQKLKTAQTMSVEELQSVQDYLFSMGSAAIRPLIDCLSHGEARGPAIEVLTRLLDDKSLPVFLETLNSPNPAAVSGVTRVLAESHSYDIANVVVLLSDTSLPKAALETILWEQAEFIPARRLISLVPELGKEARGTAFRILEKVADESVVPDAVRLLEHEDWWVRLYSVKLLGQFPNETGTKSIIKLLKDKNKGVRLESVSSLHRIKAKTSVPALAGRLRDPDLKVQSAAIDALVDIADDTAVPHLLDVLKDESEHARRAAVEVLNEVATVKAIRDLVRALRDADWWVRVRAADALGTLGGPKVVDAVVGLLRDEDDFLRRYAVEILNAVPSERAVEPLIKTLEDPDWWVRERSIDALAKTGDPRAVEPILEVMRTDATAAPLCARALGELKDPRGVQPLLDCMSSDNEELRREASTALEVISKETLSVEDREKVAAVLKQGNGPARRSNRELPFTVGGGVMPFGPESARPDPDKGRKKTAEEEKKQIHQQQENLTQGAIARPKIPGDGNINYTKLPAGTLLLNRYKILRTIGKGGFGAIYLAEDSAIEDELILKILNPQLSMDDNAIRRFVQELKLTRKITHENVIRIFDFMDLGGAHAVSMEFFESDDLGRTIRTGGPISPKRTLKIVAQTLRGLAAAHNANVIHRDIKPANILLGKRDIVKIVDFGLASAGHAVGGSRLTKSGLLIGTPEYMAPEQISGDDADERADLYSLGIMMYEMLSGQKPFTAETPVKILFLHLEGEIKPLGELIEDLPLDVEYLVSVAMARNPDDRPESAEAMLAMVEQTLADLDSAAA